MSNYFLANWPAPKNIRALTTTRQTGRSKPPYDSNNLGLHVHDHEADVLHNREQLIQSLALPGTPIWLNQTHSTTCIITDNMTHTDADAAITHRSDHPLAIMTADCLPILLCDKSGTEIAAIHAGWRGLANGIVENTIHKMNTSPENLYAWVGPAICNQCFEIGKEVVYAFTTKHPDTKTCFEYREQSIYGNLPKIAEVILKKEGIPAISQSHACTYELKNQFYSYRRSAQTGRMATLIWFVK